jgi:pyruvate kinase
LATTTGDVRAIVTTSPPATLSVAPSCEELASTEKRSAARSACTNSEAKKLAVSLSGYRRSRGSRLNFKVLHVALSLAQEPAISTRQAKRAVEPILQKRTKIVATVGPASRDPAILRSLFISGANVLRLNFSHGTPQEHADVIASARETSAQLGLHTAVLQDLPGPKVRTGPLADGLASVWLERGARFVITAAPLAGTAERVSTTYADLPADVAIGKRLYLQDGQIALMIVGKSATEIETTVEFGGNLRSSVGINYSEGTLNIPSVTSRDFEYLEFGLEQGVDYVALSFVRSAEDVERAKAFIAERKQRVPIIAKIEKHEALAELDNIIAAADGIMVARGDLGIEVPIETVPMIQKEIIAKCNRASKPVVTATQMLESMVASPRPTRAEATDVANAILDGTDAVMLSTETALGAYPTEAVRTMAEIAREVEQRYPHGSLRDRRLENIEPTIASSIAEAATRASDELKIPYIVTGTTTGNTAHHIAAFRPRARIVALTPDPRVARRLALLWGTESLLIDAYASIDVLIYVTERAMVREGLVRSGDLIAFTTGMPVGSGGTNVLKIHQIP